MQLVIRTLKASMPLRWRKRMKVARAKVFESLGSTRFSHPALFGLDLLMAQILPDVGTFLEVGANDGYDQSNTYYLEVVRGWNGILIEPLPSLFASCVRVRKRSTCYNVACVAPGRATDKVVVVDQDLQSVALGQQAVSDETVRLAGGRGAKTVAVSATTLSAVIDNSAATHIDFMSIDVEGAELSLLAGLDFSRHTPSWALIETSHPGDVAEMCAPWMVLVRKLSFHDYLFRAACEPPIV